MVQLERERVGEFFWGGGMFHAVVIEADNVATQERCFLNVRENTVTAASGSFKVTGQICDSHNNEI